MFKHLTIVALTVLLSVSASAQAKKKSAKKKTAAPKAATLPETAPEASATEATPAPATPAASEPAATPAPVASTGRISQFNWQPGDGKSAFDLGLTYTMDSGKGKNKTSGADVGTLDMTIMNIGFGYHYGFSATNSVGIATAFGNSSTKITPTAGSSTESKDSGLGDIFIVSKNYMAMGDAKFLYGVSLGFSPGMHKAATATSDGNNYSGGLSLPIYLGYEADMGGSYWGLRLDYGLKMERKTDSTPETTTTGGATTNFKAYYESGTDSYWNAYLGYGMTADSEVKVGSGAPSTSKGISAMLLGGSWGTYLSPGMLLALHYDAAMVSKYDLSATTEIDAHLAHGLQARARWEF
ncbi:MAG: hypothetical protein ABL958_10190 [Bdellovibrionia bacterium]